MSEVSMRPVQSSFDQTVSSTAKALTDLGFTATEVAEADLLIVSVNTADIRYTLNAAVVPTASAGHPLVDGASISISGRNLIEQFKCIRQSSDAKVQLSLFAWG